MIGLGHSRNFELRFRSLLPYKLFLPTLFCFGFEFSGPGLRTIIAAFFRIAENLSSLQLHVV
jgi:hypothetical protein